LHPLLRKSELLLHMLALLNTVYRKSVVNGATTGRGDGFVAHWCRHGYND
jgi:hypothetical protein